MSRFLRKRMASETYGEPAQLAQHKEDEGSVAGAFSLRFCSFPYVSEAVFPVDSGGSKELGFTQTYVI